MKRRWLALVLAAVMLVGMLPSAALATGETTANKYVNLAQGRAVTASSGSFNPENAVDGDVSTNWWDSAPMKTDGTDGAQTAQWLEIDLGEGVTTPIPIDSIALVYWKQRWAQDYKIETTSDAPDAASRSWTPLVSVSRAGKSGWIGNDANVGAIAHETNRTIAEGVTIGNSDWITKSTTTAPLTRDAAVQRYVRLTVNKVNYTATNQDGGHGGSGSATGVALVEFMIFASNGDTETYIPFATSAGLNEADITFTGTGWSKQNGDAATSRHFPQKAESAGTSTDAAFEYSFSVPEGHTGSLAIGVQKLNNKGGDLKLTLTKDGTPGTPETVAASMSGGWAYEVAKEYTDLEAGAYTVKGEVVPVEQHGSEAGMLNMEYIKLGLHSQIAVSGIDFASTNPDTVEEGASITLNGELTPANAGNKLVAWSSSNEDVATVSGELQAGADGALTATVTGVAAGTATITATSMIDPSVTASCTITVTGLTPEDTPEGNLCHEPSDGVHVTATQSDYESTLTGEEAIDGDRTTRNSRWSSPSSAATAAAPRWLKVDLGTVRLVNTVKLFWFNNNITAYTLQVAKENPETDETRWTTVYTQNGRFPNLEQQITFDRQEVRYIRVYVTASDKQGITSVDGNYFNVGIYEIEAYRNTPAGETVDTSGTPKGNLANAPADGVTVQATGSSWESSAWSVRAQQVNDGDTATSWKHATSETAPWIALDLGTARSVGAVKLIWHNTRVKSYQIEGTLTPDVPDSWQLLAERTGDTPITVEELETLHEFANQDVRFVRLTVTGRQEAGVTADGTEETPWNNVVLSEFEVYKAAPQPLDLTADEATIAATPRGNLTNPIEDPAEVVADASGEEATSVPASAAIDGNTTGTRWSSRVNDGPHWLKIDLGKVRAVSLVKLTWERDNVLAYNIQGSVDGEEWATIYSRDERVTDLKETITFAPVGVRYLKVETTSHQRAGTNAAGKTVEWNAVSLYEVEVYKDAENIPTDAQTVADAVEAKLQNGKVVLDTAAAEELAGIWDFDFSSDCAGNLEQVVGKGGVIYQPLVDTQVEINVVARRRYDGVEASNAQNPAVITVPGAHAANEGNDKPRVIPEIMEWYSAPNQKGKSYTLTETSRIVAPAALNAVAKETQADIKDLFGFEPSIVTSGGSAGDIILSIGSGSTVAGFDDETYLMEVTDRVTITATHATGAYWGTRSALQALKLSGNRTIAQGTARDYPEFKVRGFVLDVGRKPMSMEKLYEMAKNMSWYKMNDFHVHLNDNLIGMNAYKEAEETWEANDREAYKRANNAYSAFRLESTVQEENGANALAAKDYAYTKAEYKKFVEDSAAIGVTIVSEIDVPAHAKAITDAFPSVQLFGYNAKAPWNDHLNLTSKYDESLVVVKKIFDEYIDGGVFGPAVHFGADEYYDSHPAYRRFVKDMIAYMKDKGGIQPRVWGSLTSMSGGDIDGNTYDITREEASGVQINIWNYGWANPQQMYDLGFDLINTLDDKLYIVPDAGYYFNYLNANEIYNNWTPNNFVDKTWIPASSDQMAGAAYAIWNDKIDTEANGIDEVEVYDRFADALPYISVKMWGEGEKLDRTLARVLLDAETIGNAPGTDPYHELAVNEETGQHFSYDFDADASDASGNGHDLALTNAEVKDGALELKGGESYAEIGLDRLGYGNNLSFKINITDISGEQVIFEGDHAYGDFNIKALPVEGDSTKWHLGFSRELYDYEFATDLPVGDWVTLELVNLRENKGAAVGSGKTTVLYVDGSETPVAAVGKFVSKPDSNSSFKGKTGVTNSFFQIPVARIGSKTNSFIGLIDDVYAGAEPVAAPTYPVDPEHVIPVQEYLGVAAGSTSPEAVKNAINDDNTKNWHSAYAGCTEEDSWFEIELKEKQWVNGWRYLPRQTGTNGLISTYDIMTSLDGENWTTVVEDGTFVSQFAGDGIDNRPWQEVTFPATEAVFVRLLAKVTMPTTGTRYVSAAGMRVCRPSLLTDEKASVALPENEEGYQLTDEVTSFSPEPIVTYDGAELTKDTDYTVTYLDNDKGGEATVVVTGKGAYGGQVTLTFTIIDKPAPTTPSSRPSKPTATTVTTNDDGDKVTTVTDNRTGTVTETTEKADGTVEVVETKTDGTVTETTTDPEGGVTEKVTDPEENVTITVTDPEGEELVKVEIPAEIPAPETEFEDIDQTPWAEEAINKVAGLELVKGIGGNKYDPVTPMTRGALATVLHRLSNGKTDYEVAFKDVKENTYYTEGVAWAAKVNVVKGVSEDIFAPDEIITREQLAVMLARYAKLIGMNTKADTKALDGFVDGDSTGTWAVDGVAWAVSNGILKGKGLNNLDPTANVSRAEVAVMLDRFIALIQK